MIAINEILQTKILPHLIEENSIAILLVGSYYKGTNHQYSDIDLMVIGSGYTQPINNKKLISGGIEFDIWLYDFNFISETLKSSPSSYQTISLQSLILSFLQDHRVLFQSNEFTGLKRLAQDWTWRNQAREVLNYELIPPKEELFQQAFQENIILLKILHQKLDRNQLISHRLKDNQEFFLTVGDGDIYDIFKEIEKFYDTLHLGRVWTELKDAEKAIKLQDWTLCLASLRDVTRFLIRTVLNINEIDLLDPKFWSIIDSTKLPSDLVTIISRLYNQYPLILKFTN